MMPRLFDKEFDKLTVYPNALWKRVGFALAITIVASDVFIFGFIFNDGTWSDYFLVLESILLTIPIALPFIVIGYKRVVVDGVSQKVIYKTLLRQKRAAYLSEVNDIVFVNDSTFGGENAGYYKLSFKNDPYGKGIKLNFAQKNSTREFADFQQVAIPFIKLMLSKSSSQSEIKFFDTSKGFVFFKKRGASFIFKPFKYINLIFSAICFSLGFFLIFNPSSNNEDRSYFLIFMFLMAIINLALASKQVRFETANRIITTSYFGFFKKKHSFDQFVKFNTVRYLMYGLLHNGTNLIMVFNENGQNVEATLFPRFHKTKNIKIVVEEIERIMSAKY